MFWGNTLNYHDNHCVVVFLCTSFDTCKYMYVYCPWCLNTLTAAI